MSITIIPSQHLRCMTYVRTPPQLSRPLHICFALLPVPSTYMHVALHDTHFACRAVHYPLHFTSHPSSTVA